MVITPAALRPDSSLPRQGAERRGDLAERHVAVRGGFTLIELLVTMLLLTVVLVGLAGLQVHTIRQVTTSRRANEATRLAQAVLEDYRANSFDWLLTQVGTSWVIPNNRAPTPQPMKNVAVGGINGGPYTVRALVEDVSGIGNRLLITVQVSWLDVSPGNQDTASQRYRTLSVMMTTQRAR